MKRVLILLLALGALGAGFGYYQYNKPVASLERKKPDVEISASALISAYETNESSADSNYLGKVVQVSGKVVDITSEDGKQKIQLESANPMSMVICELEAGSETGALKAGDEVRMKGRCTGYLSDVILVQCSVVK